MKITNPHELVGKEVFNRAMDKGINISSFVDIELRRYLALIEGKSTNQNKSVDLSVFIPVFSC
jgi:hypothetical protein